MPDYSKLTEIIYQLSFRNGTEINLVHIHEITNRMPICDPAGKFAILVHGWKESSQQDWLVQLVESKYIVYKKIELIFNKFQLAELQKYRKGCIIVMDYSYYAKESYVRLVRQFDVIVKVLTTHLMELRLLGFDMDNGYLFGFSYGGQLVCEAGRRIGFQMINRIDSMLTIYYSIIAYRLVYYKCLYVFSL